jgi:hypothetical protein
MSGNPVSIQHQGYARLLSENTLQGTARIEQAVGKLKRIALDARRRRRIAARSSPLLSASS